MADESAGPPEAPEQTSDTRWRPLGAPPKEAGWYPASSNPNEQAYWDGDAWTRRRRWTVTGWIEEGVNPVVTASAPGTVAPPRFSANPYAPVTASVAARPQPSSTTSSSLTLGLFLLLICGVLLMVASDMSWVTATLSFGSRSTTINGVPGLSVNYGVNGYALFICGIVLVALTAAMLANDDWALRVLSLLTAWTSLGFAIYFLVRILQDINKNTSSSTSADVAGGLIIVMIAAVGAAGITAVRMRS